MEQLQKALTKAKGKKEIIDRINAYIKPETDFYLGSNRINNVNMTDSLKADIKLALAREAKRIEAENKPLFDTLEALEGLAVTNFNK